MTAVEEESIVLSELDAKQIAERRVQDGIFSWGTDAAPSLLAAEHINLCVRGTGLIGPYFEGGGRKARLKKASYEGRVGKAAYMYDASMELIPVLVPDEPLTIPANSIVFVESDLEFRLPFDIALRFNLQITHVHRGLLLGTGPLVDPGYWGKLCIPLHNLTNEPYEIPLKEGLFWVEFTKTTAPGAAGRRALGENEHWDITEFIRKASRQYGKKTVAIRSSIPVVALEAEANSHRAERNAHQASTAAEQAKDAAEKSQKISGQMRTIGIVAVLTAIVGVVSLWVSFLNVTQGQLNTLSARVDQLQRSTVDLATALSTQSTLSAGFEQSEANQAEQLRDVAKAVEDLRADVTTLRSSISEAPAQAPPEQPSAAGQ